MSAKSRHKRLKNTQLLQQPWSTAKPELSEHRAGQKNSIEEAAKSPQILDHTADVT